MKNKLKLAIIFLLLITFGNSTYAISMNKQTGRIQFAAFGGDYHATVKVGDRVQYKDYVFNLSDEHREYARATGTVIWIRPCTEYYAMKCYVEVGQPVMLIQTDSSN